MSCLQYSLMATVPSVGWRTLHQCVIPLCMFSLFTHHRIKHASAKLYEVSEACKTDLSLLSEAQRLQGIIARADFTIAKASISGTKFLLEKLHGYGGLPRSPLPPIDTTSARNLWDHPNTQDLIRLEREVSGKI